MGSSQHHFGTFMHNKLSPSALFPFAVSRAKGLSLGVTFRSCLLREQVAEHGIPALLDSCSAASSGMTPQRSMRNPLFKRTTTADPVHRSRCRRTDHER